MAKEIRYNAAERISAATAQDPVIKVHIFAYAASGSIRQMGLICEGGGEEQRTKECRHLCIGSIGAGN